VIFGYLIILDCERMSKIPTHFQCKRQVTPKYNNKSWFWSYFLFASLFWYFATRW